MSVCHLFQIHYDAASRAALDPGFTPLDNSENLRPDWFELWPIMRYLENTPLDDDAWYGFFSPSFKQKTGIVAASLRNTLKQVEVGSPNCNVMLIQHYAFNLRYFLNSFEQGELLHAGLAPLTQAFLDDIGCQTDVFRMVQHVGNMTFSNYVIAKAGYWRRWLELARALYDTAESQVHPLSQPLSNPTYYTLDRGSRPMKVFIQERLMGVVLQDAQAYRAASVSLGDPGIPPQLFVDAVAAAAQLAVCDQLKRAFCTHGRKEPLDAYWQVRDLVRSTPQNIPALRRVEAMFRL